jgi:hypothetical protein
MSTRPATSAELIELVRPFAGAKLNRARDARGYVLPQTDAIDLLAATNRINADVRSVSGEGVGVFFYDRVELIRWSDVRRVTVRSLNGDGSTEAQAVYEHRAAGRLAA